MAATGNEVPLLSQILRLKDSLVSLINQKLVAPEDTIQSALYIRQMEDGTYIPSIQISTQQNILQSPVEIMIGTIQENNMIAWMVNGSGQQFNSPMFCSDNDFAAYFTLQLSR